VPQPLRSGFVQDRPFAGPTGWLEEAGLAALTLRTCVAHYLAILCGRARLDLPAFAGALRQTGLSILPALTLVSITVGLIFGSLTASVLARFDLPGLIMLSIDYTVVMELAPILVGILVAGRAGVALAVRQASLASRGEIDGLLVNGIDPLQYTVGPVLLAMLLMSFAFAVWSSLLTVSAAFLWLWGTAGVSPALFLDSLRHALTPADLLEALGKPLVFAVLVALIATVNGTSAGRDAEGAPRAATRTMIGAVTAILLTDLVFALLTRG
jgi:phospholipid/cholesterol/gamma-HCH transport system permease protein